MLIFTLGFCIGTVLATMITGSLLAIGLISIGLCGLYYWQRHGRLQYIALLTLALSLGAFCTTVQLQQYQAWQVPPSLITKNLDIIGDIVSIPTHKSYGDSFLVHLIKMQDKETSAYIRLGWYSKVHPILRVGQRWQWNVRLKPPHGLQNFGVMNSFYSFWLQGIQATGTVATKHAAHLLGEQQCCKVDQARQRLQERIQHAIGDPVLGGIIGALTMGAYGAMNADTWQVFQRTGTSHLIAISGANIGLVAAVVFFLINWLWRLLPRGIMQIPAPLIAALAAMFGGVGYCILAGMSLPTQRAGIMITMVMLGQLFYRHVLMWKRLTIAFLFMVIWQPAALFSVSFWLTFLAVLWMNFALAGRIKKLRGWQQWGWLQTVISLGLLPVTLLFFQQNSVITFAANLIAIPWLGIVIVPLCLLGTVILGISLHWGEFIFYFSAKILYPLWLILQWMSHWSFAMWSHPIYAPWIFITAIVAMLLLCAPRGWPGRWLGILWLLPLFFYRPATPTLGEMWFTLLDVGQGLASVIQTQHHTLIYDSGPSYPGGFDAGTRVIWPYLQYRGLKQIDTLMISHGDNDHSGGAIGLLKQVTTKQISSSIPNRFNAYPNVIECMAGQQWQWDNVKFNVLYPPAGLVRSSNNGSCVLRVQAGKQVLLLTGDIEKQGEKWLMQNKLSDIRASVLVAPHHGSKSSSTHDFIQLVFPKYVLFATGFYNRFHFPNAKVLERYHAIDATLLNTAIDGAIFMQFETDEIKVRTLRSIRCTSTTYAS